MGIAAETSCIYLLAHLSVVDDESIELGDPENLGIAFRTTCQSVVEREI